MTSDARGSGFDSPSTCPAHASRTPLHGPEFAADPHSVYIGLQQKGPFAPVELAPGVPATLVVGYDAALEVLRDPATFPKDPRRWQERVPADCPTLPMMGYRPNCLFNDGAVHERLRQAVTDSFERVDLNTLRTYVERSADTLIERFGPSGKADLMTEYARVLPLMVLSLLFGCPPDIGDRIVAGMSGIFDLIEPEKSNAMLTQALMDQLLLKRRDPGADLTSWLMAHPAQLTDEEMVHQLAVLMGAGTEPEQNLIANTVRLLLSDERFAGDLSGGSLPIEDALDEVLWTDPPMANYGITYPIRDIDVAGVRLPKDEPVVISFAAVNSDPAIASDERMGNRGHLAWSAGPHACPVRGQARLIAAIAVEKVLDRLPDMELAVPSEQLAWRPGPFHRALTALPVQFTPISIPTIPDATSKASQWSNDSIPSSSTPQAATSRPRPRGSKSGGQRRWWSFLAAWWRGQ